LVFLVLVLLGFGRAGAAVIFDNGTPLPPGGLVGFTSDFEVNFQRADDFTLAPGMNTIRTIHWWGLNSDAGDLSNDFTIRIFDDVSGTPSISSFQTVFQGTAQRELVSVHDPDDRFFFSASIPDLTLPANTQHWISIVNQSPSSAGSGWSWAASSTTGDTVFRNNDGDSWNTSSQRSAAFFLTDDLPVTAAPVPEPASFALFSLVALATAILERRKE